MKYLGHLIDFDTDAANEYLEFQDVLDNFDYDEKTKLFDPTHLMERVIDSIIGFIKASQTNR